ncbi:MAG: SDR family NAD(P)-dependent oxidoreductase [Christensenellales bacterium]|jgi:short-subunit dehydrogenase
MSIRYTAITGASSGIGRRAALEFAKRGKSLILIARREDRLLEVKAEATHIDPSVDVVIRPADLSVAAGCHSLYESLKDYEIETWINNAGFGYYGAVAGQPLDKIETMLRVNIEALTILSTLYARDYSFTEGAQLINVSSAGGYTIVPPAVTYCAAKFYVSAFTEGLSHELKAQGAALSAKVLAPAATRTEFGQVANDVADYDYDKNFSCYHTVEQAVDFLMRLYDGDKTVGVVSRETFEFTLRDAIFPYAGKSAINQKLTR